MYIHVDLFGIIVGPLSGGAAAEADDHDCLDHLGAAVDPDGDVRVAVETIAWWIYQRLRCASSLKSLRAHLLLAQELRERKGVRPGPKRCWVGARELEPDYWRLLAGFGGEPGGLRANRDLADESTCCGRRNAAFATEIGFVFGSVHASGDGACDGPATRPAR
jgi:hypothetical protein